MTSNKVILKPGKEKAILNHHHWIFSGAIATLPSFKNGEILPVYAASEKFLGHAYFNSKTSIQGRMLTFDAIDPLEAVKKNIKQAIQLRTKYFDAAQTNAYRLINGEGDCLPGLIVDKYHDVLVLQISTLGMDLLRPMIVDCLIEEINPRIVFEKSLLPSRKEEGLSDFQGFHFGPNIDEVEIKENGLRFLVSLKEGQKTGFFLDQKEMRLLIRNLSCGKRVLNCFSYTGGFSVFAAAGKASSVVSVDISEKAVELAQRNMEINGFAAHHIALKEDVFNYLRNNNLDHDLVILDPPAFAKKQKDIVQACRGYKDINRLAMQKMPAKSLLLTCSCSYHVEESLFQKVLFQAAIEAKRQVRIVERHRQAFDHPINLFHPESAYLKSFLLYLD
jgi:23S rRNA (cytosine1962-C5)-methyltransferase